MHVDGNKVPRVSVIMPVYNESKYIAKCIDSLLLQDYPIDDMEWVFVDGASPDNTKEIIGQYIERYPSLIRVYDNPNKTVPYAMNIGIQNTVGEYIVRLDAHAEYASDYISQCVHFLDTTDADNVGGHFNTRARTKMGSRIALMLSSKFGVGNAQFRVRGKDGYVDTVPFGAFRRETFDKFGLFDERFTRNQDNELNWRIRRGGGKIYMTDKIQLTYYCRDTIGGINKMGYINGKWNVITMALCFGSMGIRHFIPLAFLLSLVFMPIISALLPFMWLVFAAEMALYLALDIGYSAIYAAKAEGDSKLMCFLSLLILFPSFHVSYGFGSLVGLFKLMTKEFRHDLRHRAPQTVTAIKKAPDPEPEANEKQEQNV